MFRLCGFDNLLSLKNIRDEHIDEIQEAAKDAKYPNDLKIYGGHRLMITEMAIYVNEIIERDGLIGAIQHFTLNGVVDAATEITDKMASHCKIQDRPDQTTNRTNYLLNKLLSAADKNSNREKGGYRYDADIKLYASHLRMLCGPLAYETLQKNLEGALPSLPSTNRYIRSSNCHIFEGVLRSEELLIYLEERNLPLVVSLSEDATRIVGKVQYDSITNQLVGFIPPINSQNGMPVALTFPARNTEEMFDHFNSNLPSHFLNIIMAQPIAHVPSFCLLIFGSDNKYTANEVSMRWEYITCELKKLNIKVITVASDSDPRYNAAMRQLSELGTSTNDDIHWFSCGKNKNSPFYVQDPVHIVTKMRNFLLKTGWNKNMLPFGKYFISIEHLHELLKLSKDHHQLTSSVLNPKDRQNFSSAQRMFDEAVITLLRSNVKNSEGTITYLELMRDTSDAYLDSNLSPLERIRKSWYSLFIFRIWRQFINSRKQYNLKDNFLTLNCYTCVELNAHSIVRILLYCEKNKMPHLFIPHLFDSQPCEKMFRQFRSFTSTYSTVTNCTVKEAVSRISKIQLQNEIMHSTSTNFLFPRYAKQYKSLCQTNKYLPTAREVFDEITRCESDAIATAIKLKLISNAKAAGKYECKIKPFKPKLEQFKTRSLKNNNENICSFKLSDLRNIQLKNYYEKIKETNITEESPYIQIKCEKERKIIVKKTSLCWLLATERQKLSSDRIYRVRSSTIGKINKKRKLKQKRYARHQILLTS